MKGFDLALLGVLSITARTCQAQNIAELLGTFSFTSTLLSLATLDDENLEPIVDRLTSNEATTLFAPSDEAFAALGNDVATFLSQNLDVLADVLLYHVVDGEIPASAITTDSQSVTTLQGEDVEAVREVDGPGCRLVVSRLCDEDIFINDSRVFLEDQFASNGVVHVIDEVLTFPGLLPSGDLIDTADGAGLDLLVAAVEFAGLESTLRGSGPFTVFAPTDDAFEDLGDVLEFLLTSEGKSALTDVLLYHVVIGKIIKSKDIESKDRVETALGEKVRFFVDDDDIFIEDSTDILAEVLVPDVLALNGVAHVIDKVLIPEDLSFDEESAEDSSPSSDDSEDLVDTAKDADLDLLVAAVQFAGLEDTLRSDGPFTVFAPTDDAFEDLGTDALEFLSTEEGKDTLTDILLYHVVVDAVILSDEVRNGQRVTTALGSRVRFLTNGGELFIRDSTDDLAKVLVADVLASNGVAHVIDKVLIPP